MDVQHAQAYRFLCVENLKADLSEELIKETHAILMADTVREDGHRVTPGEWRSGPITAGPLVCPPAKVVPRLMKAHISCLIRYTKLCNSRH
jgi:Fic family protein